MSKNFNNFTSVSSPTGAAQLVGYTAAAVGGECRITLDVVKSYVLTSPAIDSLTLGGLAVTLGAADSAGTGYRALRVPNA